MPMRAVIRHADIFFIYGRRYCHAFFFFAMRASLLMLRRYFCRFRDTLVISAAAAAIYCC